MRILHVTDLYRPRVGGIELFVEGLTRRQAAAGHDVEVLTSSRRRGHPDDREPFAVHRVPLAGYVPLSALPVDLADYDVVHAHLSVVSVFATRVAKLAARSGVPVVTTVHSMWNGKEFWCRIVGSLATWGRLPHVWTSVSDNASATIRAVLGPDADLHVVGNAVDVDWWRDVPGGPQASRDTGDGDGDGDGPGEPAPVTFVTVMRLAGRKRPLQLIDMLAEARLHVPRSVPMRLVVIGDGPLEQQTRSRITQLGIDWVELTGQRTAEEIRAAYAEGDVFVAPSLQESFGIAALEARTAGLPVVAMRSGGVGEFVRHGVEGLLCEDDAAMMLALARLAADPELLATMQHHNRTHPPVHDWSMTLEGFDRVYAAARHAATVDA